MNISYYYQCWKQDSLNRKFKRTAYTVLEIEIFRNIKNAFTVTFDQFKAALLNKSMNFYQKMK